MRVVRVREGGWKRMESGKVGVKALAHGCGLWKGEIQHLLSRYPEDVSGGCRLKGRMSSDQRREEGEG